MFLMQHALTRSVSAGEILNLDNAPVTHAIFLNHGIVSLMGERVNGGHAEMASVGREGFLGAAVVLGGETTLYRSVVRVSGEVTYIPLLTMREAGERFPCFRFVITHYTQAFIEQLMENILCARLDQAQAQIADWLSLAHIRMDGAPFRLTQDSLAEALGVCRVTVGATLSMMKREGVLAYSRGLMTIKEPAQLARYGSESHLRILETLGWQN